MSIKSKSVKINFIMNFILTISNFIFPLITYPYVSRILNADRIGTITFVSSNVSYFAMIAMLGIPTYGIRACAKVREDKEQLSKTVHEILLINLVMTFFALIALFIAVLHVERFYQEKELYMIMATSLFLNILGVDWLYRALERYAYITSVSIIFKFLSLILLFFLVKKPSDYIYYGGVTVLASAGSNVMNLLNLHHHISFKSLKELQFLKHLKPILTFFLLTVSTTIYLNLDTTMLGFIKGDVAVGYYSAAVKIKQILISIVTSLGAVLLPRLSFYYEKNQLQEFEQLTQKALNFIFVLALPLVCYFTLMAKESILFLSSETFLPSVLPMQLIMPTVLFIGLSNLTGVQILVPTNREKLVVLSTVAGAIVDLIINSFAISLWGPSGAAVASTLAELAVVLTQFYFLRDLIGRMLKNIQFVKIVLALLLSLIGTILIFKFVQATPFISLMITALVFFSIYSLSLLITKEKFVYQYSQSILRKIK